MLQKIKKNTISFKTSLYTSNQIDELCNLYDVDKSKLIRLLLETEHGKIVKFKKMAEKKQGFSKK